MTGHEKDCALAALALRIERARKLGRNAELREMRQWYREVLATPCDLNERD